MTRYQELFDKIGCTIEETLLEQALCRTAYARENAVPLSRTMDYLAVLGDAVIEISVIQSIIDAGITDRKSVV